ncbi:MAG: hypothetical protein EOP06_17200 [Proteobacteria bacterium]|nr:MAG: hypothetical protein EOP06_17200 [Pseudomonadota bacterium]
MSKKEKEKEKKSKKNDLKKLVKKLKISDKCKSSCCEKYKKSEDKRCKLCPKFDLIEKFTSK